MPNPAISPKRAAFVREYVKDFNATAAALRAGYSARTAASQGGRLLDNVEIQTAIKQLTDSATSACIMDHIEACEILTAMARGHIGHYMGEDGAINQSAITGTFPQAVQSVDVVTQVDDKGNVSHVTKLRLNDRVRAIERLAKLRGWDAPTKVAPTTPDGTEPYQPVMSPEEAAATYMEAMQRAVSRD